MLIYNKTENILKMKKIKLLALPLALSLMMVGCKKDFLTTVPSDAVPRASLFETTAKTQLFLDGAYKNMFSFALNGTGRHDDFGPAAYQLDGDLMGNDMVVHSLGYGWFNSSYQYTEYAQVAATRHPERAWNRFYYFVGVANELLERTDAAAGTQQEKDIIKGQAHGMRAFAYYYLINYFQQTYKGNEGNKGVPLHLVTTDPNPKGRGTVQEVYDAIIADLAAAETLLNGKPRASKNNIDVSVVRGFQARVALLQEDWTTAATKANQARQGYTLMTAAQYQGGFNDIANVEWMWGSRIPSAEATVYASLMSHFDITNNGYAGLGGQKKITKALYDMIPAGDVRKTVFRTVAAGATTQANPPMNQLKFRVKNAGSWEADYLYMRAAEMYLIEAEALARQGAGQEANARTVLQTLVQARFPAYTTSATGTALINEILLQRRIELWGEGFALIDIKRLKTGLNRPGGDGNHGGSNLQTGSLAGSNFPPGATTTGPADPRFIMKIPQAELDLNPNIPLSDQNP